MIKEKEVMITVVKKDIFDCDDYACTNCGSSEFLMCDTYGRGIAESAKDGYWKGFFKCSKCGKIHTRDREY